MRLVAYGFAALLPLTAGCGGCVRNNPGFCCLTVEDCHAFDVDGSRPGEDQGLGCVGNECVEPADASVQPDGVGPDANSACLLAGGQIVFQTDRDGDTEIALVLADGSGYRQLTFNTWADE